MPMLPDGTYDVVVVDAEAVENAVVRVELAVTLGPHLGRVVTLRAAPRTDDGSGEATDADALAVSWLGVGGTLRVRDGRPQFRPETP